MNPETPLDDLRQSRRPKEVIVIGAGVVGMATALTLADSGHAVTLLDGAQGPGMGTSYANGGQLSYTYTDAFASPATLLQLPRLMLALDPAFRLHPRFDPDFLRWGIDFLRNASSAAYRRNTLDGMTLAFESRHALHGLIERHGLEFSHSMPGKMIIYRSAKGFAAAERMAAIKAREGAQQKPLDADGAVAVEPMLAPVRAAIAGALFDPSEEVGDAFKFCRAIQTALVSNRRYQSRFGISVHRIDTSGRLPAVVTSDGLRWSADHVVLCGGCGSFELARALGVRLSIMPMKGYSITAAPGPQAPQVSITDATNRVVFARLGDRMRIAGLADFGQRNTRVCEARLDALIGSARAALPRAADYDAVQSTWAGLRPMTPDSLPIIRPIAPGVIANTGHGALGWTYAAGSALRVGSIIEGRL